MNNRRTILLVDDSAEAQVIYRRYLEQETHYQYEIARANSGTSGLIWCQQATPDLILLDYLLPDMNGLKFLECLRQQSGNHKIPTIVLTSKGDESIAVELMKQGAQDYVVKDKITSEGLCRAVRTILERTQLQQELEQQQEQQRLIASISLHIRQSLNLKDILSRAVEEVRQLLQADRVVVCQFDSRMNGAIVAESVLPGWTALLGTQIAQTDLFENGRPQCCQIENQIVHHITDSELTDRYIHFLQRFQVKAQLVIPILLNPQGEVCPESGCDRHSTDSCLWGLLVVHQCDAPRQWQPLERELLHQLTTQLTIAIRQAELYQSVQTLNANLEEKVHQRTAELHQLNQDLKAEISSRRKMQKALEESQFCLRLINAITADRTPLHSRGEAIEHILGLIRRFFPELGVHYYTIDTHDQLQTQVSFPAEQDCNGKEIQFDMRQVPTYLAMLQVGQPLVAPDIWQEPKLSPMTEVLQQIHIRAMLAVPLKHTKDVLGLLSLTCDRKRTWSRYEIQALAEIAGFLSLTLQSVTLQSQQQIAEQALQESERKFRAIFDNTFQFTGLLTPDGTLLEINQTALDFGGVHREDVINCPIWETSWWAISSETQTQLRQAITCATQGEFVRYKVDVLGAADNIVTIDFSLRPLKDESGQVALLILEGRDISELRQAEQERDRLLRMLAHQNQTLEEQVAQRTAELRTIIDALPDYVFVISRDENRLICCNDAYAQSIYNLPREHIENKLISEYFSPENAAYFDQQNQQVFESGQPLQIQETITLSTGTFTFDTIKVPLRNSNGEIYAVVGTARDITARKQAEDTLTRQLATIEAAIDGIAILNEQHHYIYLNQAHVKLLGYDSAEEVLGKSWKSLYSATEIERLEQSVFPTLLEKGAWHGETISTRKDGSTFNQEVSLTLAPKGEVICVCRDVSDRRRTEQALRESEEKFRQLAETVEDVFWILNLDRTERVYVSPAYEKIWGRSCHDLHITPDAWLESIYRGDRERVAAAIDKQLQGEYDEEYRIVRPDGELRWIRDRAFPIRNDKGEVYRIAGVAEDITDRKEAEIEISRNRDLREAIFNESTDAIFLVNAETLLTIDCNRRAVELFEADSKYQLVNISININISTSNDDNSNHNNEIQHSELPETEVKKLLQTVNSCGFWNQEIEFISLKGNKFWGSLAAKQINVAGWTVHLVRVTDISERKHSEILLQSQKEFLRRLIDTVPNLIFVKNWKGQFQLVNQATANIYGTTIESLLGKAEANFNPNPLKTQQFLSADTEVMETLRPKVLEETITSVDGEKRFFQTIQTPIISLDGQSREILAVATDITDRKRAEEQLRKSNEQLASTNVELARATRLKDEFLANMSHELRTPLNAILGISEGLQEEVYGVLTERQHKALATIEQSGRHLLELINDILDLAKIGSGKIELQITTVTLGQLCDASFTFVKQQALQKNIHFNILLPNQQETIQVDERRIRQALINLLSNAVKFTPEGGSVTLEVQTEVAEEIICFQVHDTGIGIAPENMDKLFQAFVQIDSRLSRSYSGTGLGLALVRQIAEIHGGSVSVQSAVGQGSSFTIKLPYRAKSVGVEQPTNFRKATQPLFSELRPLLPDPSLKPLILLAEDNEANIDTIASYLVSQDYRLVLASNGLEALTIAKAQSPQIILMDIQMPQMDGLEAIRLIRAESRLCSTPIIALTALAMPGDRDRCLAAGANEYLTKPVSLRQLASLVNTLLESASHSKG